MIGNSTTPSLLLSSSSSSSLPTRSLSTTTHTLYIISPIPHTLLPSSTSILPVNYSGCTMITPIQRKSRPGPASVLSVCAFQFQWSSGGSGGRRYNGVGREVGITHSHNQNNRSNHGRSHGGRLNATLDSSGKIDPPSHSNSKNNSHLQSQTKEKTCSFPNQLQNATELLYMLSQSLTRVLRTIRLRFALVFLQLTRFVECALANPQSIETLTQLFRSMVFIFSLFLCIADVNLPHHTWLNLSTKSSALQNQHQHSLQAERKAIDGQQHTCIFSASSSSSSQLPHQFNNRYVKSGYGPTAAVATPLSSLNHIICPNHDHVLSSSSSSSSSSSLTVTASLNPAPAPVLRKSIFSKSIEAPSLSLGDQLEVLTRLAVAAMSGGFIGLERKTAQAVVGMRTTSLVSLGSAVFTITSLIAFPASNGRAAAQITSGMGFVAAGCINASNTRQRGLATATSLWISAALGVASACGLYSLAMTGSMLTVLILKYGRVELWKARLEERSKKQGEAAMMIAGTGTGAGAVVPGAETGAVVPGAETGTELSTTDVPYGSGDESEIGLVQGQPQLQRHMQAQPHPQPQPHPQGESAKRRG